MLKENDWVSKKNVVIDTIKKRGKVIRIYEDTQRASIMWVLECGGIMCQAENIDTLILLEESKL